MPHSISVTPTVKQLRRYLSRLCAATLGVVIACGCGAADLQVDMQRGLVKGIQIRTVLKDTPVSIHAINLVSTPLALCNGRLVVVTVEDPSPSASRLLTIARVGEPTAAGVWQWRSTVIEDRTLPDDYHTQPSVGVDGRGYIHIAYNMHNMPWQYVVSRAPCSLDEGFDFRGQAVSDTELHAVFEENRSPFPDPGNAEIPGNQITYPAFFNDRRGTLYVSYRFAVRPGRPWLERAFAAGIARFDANTREWRPIGGRVPLTASDASLPSAAARADAEPFAWEPGWTVYPARLWFDRSNQMHATWTWRKTEAGGDTVLPSYAYGNADNGSFKSANGISYQMPITQLTTQAIDLFPGDQKFVAATSITTDSVGPLALLEPIGGQRTLARYDAVAGRWRSAGASPFGATRIVCEDSGTCWAYASGPRVLVRTSPDTQWRIVLDGKGYCDPKPFHDMRSGRRFLYVARCDQRAANVFELLGTPRS